MEFQDVVRKRRMVRDWEPRPIPADVRDRIVANAQRAPSGGNSQGWAFLVIEGEDRLARFWETAVTEDERAGSAKAAQSQAPLVIVPFSHKRGYLERYSAPDKQWTGMADETRWPAPYWDIDTGMASLLMLLTAVDAGLGALFFGILKERMDGFRAAFGVPAEYHPIGAIVIGYIAESEQQPHRRRDRKPVGEVVHYGHW